MHEWSRSNASHNWSTWWGNIRFATDIDITVIPEGFYDVGLNRMNKKDTVTAYLRNTALPYAKMDSAKAVIDSLTFKGSFSFRNISSGTYYLSINHRNSIETWSKAGGEAIIKGSTINYDFTNHRIKHMEII